MQYLSKLELMNGKAKAVVRAKNSNYVYIASKDDGFHIADVSDHSAPVHKSKTSLTDGGKAMGLSLQEIQGGKTYLYVAAMTGL